MSYTASRAAAVVLSAGAALAVTVSPALAQTATCDAYSGTCQPPTEVLPTTLTSAPPTTTEVRGSTVGAVDTPSSLPFTGGELVALSLAGAGALAAGGVLVAAGRRRPATVRADQA